MITLVQIIISVIAVTLRICRPTNGTFHLFENGNDIRKRDHPCEIRPPAERGTQVVARRGSSRAREVEPRGSRARLPLFQPLRRSSASARSPSPSSPAMVAASPPLVSRCLSRDYPRTISGDSYAELSAGSPPDFGSGEPTSVEKALRSEIATLRDDRQAVLDALEAVRRERHSSESPPRGADRGTEDGGTCD